MPRALIIQPHSDDAALFCCFTAIRTNASIITVFDSNGRESNAHCVTFEQRHAEDLAAMTIIGGGAPPPMRYFHLPSDIKHCGFILNYLENYSQLYDEVYAPAWEEHGHPHHNMVHTAAHRIFDGKVTNYTTYTYPDRLRTKTRSPVPFMPEWTIRKWQALACYRSQIILRSTNTHFMQEQYEYYE